MKTLILQLLATMLALPLTAQTAQRDRIDLSGQWQFALDEQATRSATDPFDDTVTLPGTTDTNHRGHTLADTTETTHLSRRYNYKGRAWYSRSVDIPPTWAGRDIRLHLERSKPCTVYVDGQQVGRDCHICFPQVSDLSRLLTPGRHTLTLLVDNGSGVPEQLYGSSHAFTEDTQTNWNGVIGQLYLESSNALRIQRIDLTPLPSEQKVRVRLTIEGRLKKKTAITLRVLPQNWHGEVDFLDLRGGHFRRIGDNIYQADTAITLRDQHLWSEFQPHLYALEAEIEGADVQSKTFGMRHFTADQHHFYINGQKTFLRGKHDACVFPLTAHVPMDEASWRKYLLTCRQYGINHVRFHSWCPPEAAFQVADELGIYLQPELPFWGDFKADDATLMDYLLAEGEGILREYGHHPSFVMFALGNELWGSIEKMGDFIEHFRHIDASKLYTFGSNYYLGYQGVKPGMDYFTTCRIGGEAWGNYNTHTRGSFSFADAADGGVINHFRPNSSLTFDEACDPCAVPVISHETGQFQHIPDFDAEIPRYTGVLHPYNMKVFRGRLQKAGLLDELKLLNLASGSWAARLYKADIEMDLRTRNMAGFQLLDLQDYPGQGSAYVGMLDAFMHNKGFVDEQTWRGFCDNRVPLFVADKFCFTEAEGIQGNVQLANYSGHSLKGKTLKWALLRLQPGGNGSHQQRELVEQGQFKIETDSLGLIDVGTLHVDLPQTRQAHKHLLLLKLDGKAEPNSYELWTYPSENLLDEAKNGIVITSEMTDEIGKKLQNGARVLWMPTASQQPSSTTQHPAATSQQPKLNTLPPLFQTDYWNYRMFKTICENNKKDPSPGTMGIVCYPQHPIFHAFPTDMHTNWQWFAVVKHSRPLVLDAFPKDVLPVVQVIDNIERNHRLGLIMEFAVGKGRLLLCMSDLEKAAEQPEGRQFYVSLLQYMRSNAFLPKHQMTLETLLETLSRNVDEQQMDELNNISPY